MNNDWLWLYKIKKYFNILQEGRRGKTFSDGLLQEA
jgi:hypothetical protein